MIGNPSRSRALDRFSRPEWGQAARRVRSGPGEVFQQAGHVTRCLHVVEGLADGALGVTTNVERITPMIVLP